MFFGKSVFCNLIMHTLSKGRYPVFLQKGRELVYFTNCTVSVAFVLIYFNFSLLCFLPTDECPIFPPLFTLLWSYLTLQLLNDPLCLTVSLQPCLPAVWCYNWDLSAVLEVSGSCAEYQVSDLLLVIISGQYCTQSRGRQEKKFLTSAV